MEEEYKYSEMYQQLVGRLVLDREFREAVLGQDEMMRANALDELGVKDSAAREEITTYLRFRRREIRGLLDNVDQDVSFMA